MGFGMKVPLARPWNQSCMQQYRSTLDWAVAPGNNNRMSLRIETYSFDSVAPAKIAQFWAMALDWQIVDGGDPDEVGVQPRTHRTDTGAQPELMFLRVPDAKSVKNRMHLDLRPDDQGAEVARLESLGAVRADVGQGDAVSWVVMADPEGNEFCVLRALRPHGLDG